MQGVKINGTEHKIALFADDIIAFLEQPNKSLPVLMKLLDMYRHLAGYKINISKTQILSFNYSPSKEIQDLYDLNWNLKKMKYLGVSITKGIIKLYKENYDKINHDLQNDIIRWATLPLDFSSRIEIININVLPRLLYLFHCLPVEVTQAQFETWNKLISRFIWADKKPRIRYETLQLPKDKGGMGLPRLKEYYLAAQLRYLLCWCKPGYRENGKI